MNKKTKLNELLKRYFGYDVFKESQEEIINSLMSGRNVFVLMPTGGGKSLCYQLPSLLMEGTAVVISPLIALMKNQVDVMRNLSEHDGIAHYLNSSLARPQIDEVREDVLAGRTKLLYVAPESLMKPENVELLKSIKISFYAIDEAHCISEWGHDFRPEYRRLRNIINRLGVAPIIALTATATEKVKQDIKKSLKITDCVEYTSSFNRPNLYYEVRRKTDDVDADVIRFIKRHSGVSGIIYCLSRKKVEDLAEILCQNGIKAAAYHAGLETEVRAKTQDDFLMERIDVIVATIAFGMGIDKPDVRFVIHYDMPKSLEGYYQETGRAGRDGGEGICLAFYSEKDISKLEKFVDGKPVAEQEIGRQLLRETVAYAESSICRRKLLLHYFGENFTQENCHSCDNCTKPKKTVETKGNLQQLLSVVVETKQKFNSDYVLNILMGRATDEIVDYHHDELELFGCGADVEPQVWNEILCKALVEGLLEKDVEKYGVLNLTPAGEKWLKKPKSFVITMDAEEENPDDLMPQPQTGAECAADKVLYQMLNDLRKTLSKELDVPPYVIFQDASLEAMATLYPQTIEDLQNVPGVGAGKAKRYGPRFLELIARHCKENDIVRPEDIRIRTKPNRSALKVSLVQSIDMKMDLNDLARMKDLDFDELLDDLDSIVDSGTRLNIDYFLEEVLDEECIEQIYDYFKTSESDNIDDAMDELGEYSEQEIRLVRIKFISEMAN